jgi:N-carbamoyl-L-amino-acid hydrolase
LAQPPAVEPARVIADLRELAHRTSDDRGAQRVCWTEPWRDARSLLVELLVEIGIEPETDQAGNMWARLEATERTAPALVLGSHLDSVPDGGWLDGALGVMAAVGVIRGYAAAAEPPSRPLLLVDWADEEGARFGRSLFGSSAFAGALDAANLRDLRDSGGEPIAEVLAANGVDLARVPDCVERRDNLAAYLELHIEQGPRLDAAGLSVAAVTGCAGVERRRFTFTGQASHAGATPMDVRRDAGLAAAEAALAIERVADTEGGVATSGELELSPGVATVVPGRAALSVDLRHPEAAALARMHEAARTACAEAAAARGCALGESALWQIDPVPFDPRLVALARDACEQVTGEPTGLASGALHDAAAVAPVLPAAMLFAASKEGISHAPEEDTDEANLAIAVETLGDLVARTLRELAPVQEL